MQGEINKSNRVSSLDYLRGIAACGIMVYHYFSWNFRIYNADDFLGRVGIYGVSVFYVLSGLTLFLVYAPTFKEPASATKAFYIKRLFRIFPLMWLATIFSIILFKIDYSTEVLVNNFTGAFSIYKIDTYIATGAWSIGNEIAFYLFFPILMFAYGKNDKLMVILSVLLILLSLAFAFIYVDKTKLIKDEWHDYINPVNQGCLFVGGMLIGYFFCDSRPSVWLLRIIGFLALITFVIYPVSGDRIMLIEGFTRVVFVLLSFMVVIWFFKEPLFLLGRNLISRFFSFLGETSYSIYLIHPIIYGFLQYMAIYTSIGNVWVRIFISALVTLLISYLTFRFFEKPFIRWGARFSSYVNKNKSIHV